MNPSPERWERMKAPFQAALERPAAERDAFLAEACAGDRELLEDVRSLLRASMDAGRFLDAPAAWPTTLEETAGDESDAEAMVGAIVGAYRLLAVIGRGGMGTVYRAVRVDDVYEKAVALKLVKRGMDTAFVLRRFRDERRILAQLDHPNIARLLDGGTSPDGRPYFVMEHIEGLPLDRYADVHRLDLRRRLELFLSVCDAVQHAHRHLVVHRDLKPANILVTAAGKPKLLDFGIAKLLDADGPGERTVTVMRLMTPDYASPEQVRGEAITTAADVYALGVVLYELLAGCRPFDRPNRTPEELLRTIGREDPPPPSARAAADRALALRGELDNIVSMALRTEPSRRYASVEQLAGDVRAFLEGRPVSAQRDTLTYRTAKFVRRNRVGVAAGAAVFLSLVAGIVVASWQARVARSERERAERRFGEVRRLANALLFDIHDSVRDLAGSTPARKILVTEALRYLDGLAREAEGDAGLQRELAAAYRRVADVQGQPGGANLGDLQGALASYEKAYALYTACAAGAPRDVSLLVERAYCTMNVARLREDAGDFDAALEQIARAESIVESGLALDGRHVRLHCYLVNAGSVRGNIHVYRGQLEAALQTLRRAVTRGQAACAAIPDDVALLSAVGQAHVGLARALRETKDHREALRAYDSARALHERRAKLDPLSIRPRQSLSLTYLESGNVLADMEDWPAAVENGRKAAAISRALVAADPKNMVARHMALCEDHLLCRAETRLRDRLSPSCGRLVAEAEAFVAARPGQARAQIDLLEAHVVLGGARRHAGDRAGAIDSYRRALHLAESLIRSAPTDRRPPAFAAEARAALGELKGT